MSAGEYS